MWNLLLLYGQTRHTASSAKHCKVYLDRKIKQNWNVTCMLNMNIWNHYEWLFFHCRCVYPYILTTSFLASFMSATVINCERCISMYFPMRYHSLVTKRKLITVCVIQFLLAIGLAIMRFNVPVPASGFYCGTLVDISPSMMNRIIADAFLVGNVVAYILMIWHFKGRRRQSAVIPVSAANKALSRLTFVSSFLVLCYSPAFIMSEIQAYVPDAGFMKPAKAITALLALVNSNLNPVLFVWRFYEVRYQFLVLFCFCNKPKLAQLRENRRNYFATFDISTADGSVNTNVKDIWYNDVNRKRQSGI